MHTSNDLPWSQRSARTKASDACNGIIDDMDGILAQISPDFIAGWVGMDTQMTTAGEDAVQKNPDISLEELQDVLRQALETRGKVEFIISQAMGDVNYAKTADGGYHARFVIMSRANTLRNAARGILKNEPDVDQADLTTKLQDIARRKFS